MRLSRRLSVCALLLTATGCNNNHSAGSASTASSTVGGATENTAATAAAPAAATALGPIVAARVAHDIEPSGRALGVGIDFEPWAAKIVAVVDVGGWSDRMTKPLQFMWSSVGSDGTDVPLFSQQVDVKPGQRAYATALSPGRLALGAYRVKVAVAGATETVDLYVASPTAEEPLTAAAIGAATAATDPPTTSVSGLMRRRDAADGSVAVGEAPTAGQAGTTGEGQASETPAQAGCVLTVSPSTAGESMIWADATGCNKKDTVVLAVTNNGKEYDVPLPLAEGEASAPYDVDPCTLGLDGTTAVTVTYTLKVTGGPDEGKSSAPYTGTKAPNAHDSPPGVGLDSSPQDGSFVSTGDQIVLKIDASDDIKVSHVIITAGDGSTLVDTPYSGKPSPCRATNDHQYATASYTVPANPPEMVTLTVTVTDSAGQPQTLVAQYPTRGIWYGFLNGTISSAGPSFNCAGTFNGPIRVVVASSTTANGPVDVTGDALVRASGFGCEFPPNFPQTGNVTFTVTGTYDGKVFKLQLATSGVENVAAISVGLHLFSLPAPPLTIEAVRSGSTTLRVGSTFHRENSGPEELSGGGGSATLDGSLTLACCSPNAEPIVPAKAPQRFLGEDD